MDDFDIDRAVDQAEIASARGLASHVKLDLKQLEVHYGGYVLLQEAMGAVDSALERWNRR